MFESLPDATRVALARILLVVLAFGLIWLLRSLLIWLLAKPLDNLLSRAGRADLDDSVREIINRPSSYVLFALALDLGARFLEVDAGIMDFVHNVSRTLVIVAVATVIYSFVDVFVFSRRRLFLLTGIAVDEALIPFVRTGVKLLAWLLALVIIIQVWGYDVSGLIAGLGIGGLAISLAAQETLSNIFGFATIVSDRPLVVGEYVKTPSVEGIIERVGLRSTRVRQLDQAVVTVPNSLMASSTILNWSRLAKRQINLTLGVTYSTTPDQMETLLDALRAMLKQRETVDPESVVVYFVEFGGSALNILIRCYVNFADWGEFTAEKEKILLEIMRVVQRTNLQIAFPSRSIYIENMGDGQNLVPPVTAPAPDQSASPESAPAAQPKES